MRPVPFARSFRDYPAAYSVVSFPVPSSWPPKTPRDAVAAVGDERLFGWSCCVTSCNQIPLIPQPHSERESGVRYGVESLDEALKSVGRWSLVEAGACPSLGTGFEVGVRMTAGGRFLVSPSAKPKPFVLCVRLFTLSAILYLRLRKYIRYRGGTTGTKALHLDVVPHATAPSRSLKSSRVIQQLFGRTTEARHEAQWL